MAGRQDILAGRAFVHLFLKNDLTKQLSSAISGASASIRAVGDKVTGAGKAFLKIGGLAGVGFGFAAKASADFETQMAMISTMLDKPQEHMDRFRAAVRSMSIQFGEGTDTIAKGLYDILSASVAPEDALTVLRATIMSAKGGITDAATATQALINILNAYRIPASRVTEVSDLMFQVVKRGVITFDELAQYIGAVTATANASGLSMNQMGAAIATMTRNGLKADVAVTGLQNILSEFLKPSDEGAALAKKYGFSLSVATLQAEGLSGVMERLAKVPPDVIARMFPDVRGLRGILALRGDLQGLRIDVQQMADKSGAASEAYNKMTGTLGSAGKKIRQSFIAVLAQIGDAISGPLKKLAEIGVVVGKVAVKLIGDNQDLVRNFAFAAVAIAGAGTALVGLGLSLKIAAIALSGFVPLLGVVRFGFQTAGKAIGLLFLPITMIASLVRKTLSTAFSVLGSIVRGVASAAGTLISALLSALSSIVPALWRGVSAVFAFGWNAGKAILWFGNNLGKVASAVATFGAAMMDTFRGINQLATSVAADFGSLFTKAAITGMQMAMSLFAGLAGGIASLGVAIVAVTTIAGPIMAFFAGLWALVKNLGAAFVRIGGQIKTGVGDGIAAVRNDFDRLRDSFSGFSSFFAGWGDLLRQLGSQLSEVFGRLFEDGKRAFAGIKNAMAAEDWGLVWRIFKDAAFIAWGEIANVLGSNWDALVGRLTSAAAGLWFAMSEGAAWVFMELKIGWANFLVLAKRGWYEIIAAVSQGLGTMIQGLLNSGALGREAGSALMGVLDSVNAARERAFQEIKPRESLGGKSRAEASAAATTESERTAFEAGAAGRRSAAEANAAKWAGAIKGLGAIGVPQTEIDAARSDMKEAIAKAAEAAAKVPSTTPGAPGAPGAHGAKTGEATAAPGASAAPAGSALTATYSAAAAQIGGYGPQGPQEKMAASIYEMAQILKENNVIAKQSNASTAYVARLYERYLAALQVQ